MTLGHYYIVQIYKYQSVLLTFYSQLIQLYSLVFGPLVLEFESFLRTACYDTCKVTSVQCIYRPVALYSAKKSSLFLIMHNFFFTNDCLLYFLKKDNVGLALAPWSWIQNLSFIFISVCLLCKKEPQNNRSKQGQWFSRLSPQGSFGSCFFFSLRWKIFDILRVVFQWSQYIDGKIKFN